MTDVAIFIHSGNSEERHATEVLSMSISIHIDTIKYDKWLRYIII